MQATTLKVMADICKWYAIIIAGFMVVSVLAISIWEWDPNPSEYGMDGHTYTPSTWLGQHEGWDVYRVDASNIRYTIHPCGHVAILFSDGDMVQRWTPDSCMPYGELPTAAILGQILAYTWIPAAIAWYILRRQSRRVLSHGNHHDKTDI